MKSQDDTIAAIITPIGEGGISVLRLSGSRAIEIAGLGFHGKQPLAVAESHTVHYGTYKNSEGELLDEVLATVFKNPHSYTGEDTVEISCHGSILVTQKILESLIQFGARMAEPGEFTKRAFLNGKMDLTQAEAVADLIKTSSDQSHKASLLQLKGSTSKAIHSIKDKLLNICSLVELELDFSEEGLQFIERKEIENRIQSAIDEINSLISSYNQGRVIRDGVKVVIYGKPNVGKSSLMNALLDQERAIVTHISGTTRDTIEESIHINGILYRLVDTAGIRDTDDIIEQEGINRTRLEIQEADVIIHLLDASTINLNEFNNEQESLIKLTGKDKQLLIVLNKIDLVPGGIDHLLTESVASNSYQVPIGISAKKRIGLDLLKNTLHSLTVNNELATQEGTVTITNLRHKDLLVTTCTALLNSLQSVRDSMSGEFIASDVRTALNSLGEITGEVTTDDILNNIFANFCIGK